MESNELSVSGLLTTRTDKDRPAANLLSLPEREVDEVGDPRVRLEPAGRGDLGPEGPDGSDLGSEGSDLGSTTVRENGLVRRDGAALFPLLTSEHMLSLQGPLSTALSTSHLQ